MKCSFCRTLKMHEFFASHFMCMCAFAKSIRRLLKEAFRIFISKRNTLGRLFSYNEYYATISNFAKEIIFIFLIANYYLSCIFENCSIAFSICEGDQNDN